MKNQHQQQGQPPIGAYVTVQVTGTIQERSPHHLMVLDNTGNMHYLSVASREVKVLPIVPHHAPTTQGQLWEVPDGTRWFVKYSRPGLSLRFVPDNQSNEGGLHTLPEEDFFVQYPEAYCVFGQVADDDDVEGFGQPVQSSTQTGDDAALDPLRITLGSKAAAS